MTLQEIRMDLVKSPVIFIENDEQRPELNHTYWLGAKRLKGITSGSLVARAFPDKYKGISKATLANAATAGTAVHKMVERYEDEYAKFLCGATPFLPIINNENVAHWAEIRKANNIEVIDCEFLVSDKKHYASSIDILALVNGELSIIDIKHTSTPYYDSTALQTSIYQYLLEMQCPKLKVQHRYILWLREEKYEFTELQRISNKKIKALIKADITDDQDYVYTDEPDFWSRSLEKKLARALEKQAAAEAEVKALKEQLQKDMIDNCYKSVKSELLTISYVSGKTSSRFDMASLKKADPELAAELAEKYTKTSITLPYITIKLK